MIYSIAAAAGYTIENEFVEKVDYQTVEKPSDSRKRHYS